MWVWSRAVHDHFPEIILSIIIREALATRSSHCTSYISNLISPSVPFIVEKERVGAPRMATSSPTRSYKEGILLKRARGLHRKGALKWQERYCRLSNVSLDYYDPKKMVRKTVAAMHSSEQSVNIVNTFD